MHSFALLPPPPPLPSARKNLSEIRSARGMYARVIFITPGKKKGAEPLWMIREERARLNHS